MGWVQAQITSVVNEFKDMKAREAAQQAVNLGMVLTSALIIWKTLILVTGSESPIVVVLTGSMEPAFKRGDILFLYLGTAPVRTGEIVVYNVTKTVPPGYTGNRDDVPIVHRVMTVHERTDSNHLDILTKGDNNHGDDRWGGLYPPGVDWLHMEHIMGRAVGYLPYMGMVTIIMNDHPMLKYGLIAVLGLMVMISKE